jgi:acetylornithine deacetylase/succinyl-diaminopimelate desuccinylase-like protein
MRSRSPRGLPGDVTVEDLTQAPGVRECLNWFSRERQWINQQHLELCRIPAPTFFEEKRAEWMMQRMSEIGLDARTDRSGNMVARLANSGDGPYVAISAHLDTVLAPRNPEEIGLAADGRIMGPGVSDNGAGLAALLALAQACAASPTLLPWNGSPLFVANVAEEGEGNLSGMRYLCKQSPLASKIRAYVVLDGPSTDHITVQALASRRFEIVFNGPGGHSWSDHGVANPVHALSRMITLFTDAQSAEAGRSGAVRRSYNFGVVEGGVSVNSIPASARAKLDIRSESSDVLEEMAGQISRAVEKAMEVENARAAGGRVTVKIRETGARPGGQLRHDAAILRYVRAVDAHLKIRSQLDCASTDANIPLSMGLPAISIGAGGTGGGAHTAGEWFHSEGRDAGLKRIFLLLCLLLAE